MKTEILVIAGAILLIVGMILAARAAWKFRSSEARKRSAGFVILSSLLFGAGATMEQPPPRAEDARNNTLDKKSGSEGSKDETL